MASLAVGLRSLASRFTGTSSEVRIYSWYRVAQTLDFSTQASPAASDTVGNEVSKYGQSLKKSSLEKETRKKKSLAMMRRGHGVFAELAMQEATAAARGMRVSKFTTPTGGDGSADTTLSSSLEDTRKDVLKLYRQALESLPNMRKNFFLVEERNLLRDVIKSLFLKNKDVNAFHLVDLLVFKGRQELEEIDRQWKGRQHVAAQINKYQEQLARERNAALVREIISAEAMVDNKDYKEKMIKLQSWKDQKLVPQAIDTWEQYLIWRKEEDERFEAFAIDNGLFTKEELEANKKQAESQGMTFLLP
eukprot:CAMPEP_0184692632 /NCGR_PEP_ID=MMETSP0313-20130426/1029_1 /TAXON_ID=2792 /ORGANISM="Porphyridium aerugineum, Strain SAG 1380-2" /LENGTH=304 /DNA_ID=CAMNT_0027150473 /DNA_START=83 /DNA_END=997 /DNA_ORIENTATION=+